MNGLLIRHLCFNNLGPFNLTLSCGECIGISGPSGIGKTLLLRSISDLKPYEGDIILNDINCRDIPAPQWRKKVGMLSAESQWWYDKVGQHFLRYSEEWFSLLGFSQDVFQWEVNRLSSGEKQRLALLRLLSNNPEVLLLDEPTANLDVEKARKVENIIADYRKEQNCIVVWVSHDQNQIERVASRHFIFTARDLREQIN